MAAESRDIEQPRTGYFKDGGSTVAFPQERLRWWQLPYGLLSSTGLPTETVPEGRARPVVKCFVQH